MKVAVPASRMKLPSPPDRSPASTECTVSPGGRGSDIRWVSDISSEYEIGECVMPSTHRGQLVCFARRKTDNLKCVVKIRDKLISFKDPADISQWQEAMLNLLSWQEHFSEHIAQLIEMIEDSKSYYLMMEWVDGIDLFEFLHSCPICDMEGKTLFFRKLAYETLQALKDYARLSLVHKDIKLENVVLTDNPQPRVSGGGVGVCVCVRDSQSVDLNAQGVGEEEVVRKSPPPVGGMLKIIDFDTVEFFDRNTHTLDVMGTDQYIAPEAYDGLYTTASDMFALGTLLYKSVTGCFPFDESIFDDEAGQNYVGHPKMKQIRGKLRLAKVDFTTHPFFQHDKYAKDFIRRCLIFEDSRRLTVEEAVAHPAMREYEKVSSLKWMDFRKYVNKSGTK